MDHPDRLQRLLSGQRRSGLTMMEVIVAIVVVSLLAAITFPVVTSRLQRSHGEAVVTELENLQRAIQTFARDVGRYPFRIDYLADSTDPTGFRDACGVTMVAANKRRYRGPYINRPIVPAGSYIAPFTNTRAVLATGDSLETLLTRTLIATGTGVNQQVLQIQLKGPSQSLVQLIDSIADGVIGSTHGRVQYTTPLQSQWNTVRWTFPIPTGAC